MRTCISWWTSLQMCQTCVCEASSSSASVLCRQEWGYQDRWKVSSRCWSQRSLETTFQLNEWVKTLVFPRPIFPLPFSIPGLDLTPTAEHLLHTFRPATCDDILKVIWKSSSASFAWIHGLHGSWRNISMLLSLYYQYCKQIDFTWESSSLSQWTHFNPVIKEIWFKSRVLETMQSVYKAFHDTESTSQRVQN